MVEFRRLRLCPKSCASIRLLRMAVLGSTTPCIVPDPIRGEAAYAAGRLALPHHRVSAKSHLRRTFTFTPRDLVASTFTGSFVAAH
eukprot:scaffold9208_cov98-Isochrysis_galbana.AAC.8